MTDTKITLAEDCAEQMAKRLHEADSAVTRWSVRWQRDVQLGERFQTSDGDWIVAT
jgi:hypothetical protein